MPKFPVYQTKEQQKWTEQYRNRQQFFPIVPKPQQDEQNRSHIPKNVANGQDIIIGRKKRQSHDTWHVG